eukprot:m.248124 g.248124  ORF g.248124 m.248124 type:complete len:285 (+) comp26470_c4_seq4:4496-5350(+)
MPFDTEEAGFRESAPANASRPVDAAATIADATVTDPPPPTLPDVEPVVQVVLPCERVLTAGTVTAAFDEAPGQGPVVVWVHPGTRAYGERCFFGVRMRLVAVREQARSTVRWQMLRRLIVSIGMYEPDLTHMIRSLVPADPAAAAAWNGIVGFGAFLGCRHLESVCIPPTVTAIGDRAFYGCSSLESVIIPDAVTSIRSEAFNRCSSLALITIPDAVAFIGYSAFFRCSGLTSLTIPDSVTDIKRLAFFECSSLMTVDLPRTVTLSDDVFVLDGTVNHITITRR